MSIDRNELEELSRDELLQRAEGLGIKSASTMTRPDLIDEIISVSVSDDTERRVARGFLGRARDLVARVVSKGLNLPDAAQRILASPSLFPQREPSKRPSVKPIPTVALAQVYASQGHRAQAIEVLDQLRNLEPNKTDTIAAARLREQLTSPNKPEPTKPEPTKLESDEPESNKPEPTKLESDEPESIEPTNVDSSSITVGTVANDTADETSVESQDTSCADPKSSATPPSLEAPASQRSEAPALQLPVPVRDSLEVTRDGLGFLVSWSVRPLTFARARVKAPRGELVLRAVHVRVCGEKAVSHVHDVAITTLFGQTRCECESDCVACHVAVGWSDGALFFPLIA